MEVTEVSANLEQSRCCGEACVGIAWLVGKAERLLNGVERAPRVSAEALLDPVGHQEQHLGAHFPRS